MLGNDPVEGTEIANIESLSLDKINVANEMVGLSSKICIQNDMLTLYPLSTDQRERRKQDHPQPSSITRTVQRRVDRKIKRKDPNFTTPISSVKPPAKKARKEAKGKQNVIWL